MLAKYFIGSDLDILLQIINFVSFILCHISSYYIVFVINLGYFHLVRLGGQEIP